MAEGVKVSHFARVLYSIVLFFAYWFGASRFDYDGDGDFDPSDVQAYLTDEGVLANNFRQSRTSRIRNSRGSWLERWSMRGDRSSTASATASGSPAAARRPGASITSDGTASAEVAGHEGLASQGLASQGLASQGLASQGLASQVLGSEGAEGNANREGDGSATAAEFWEARVSGEGGAEEDIVKENLFERQLIPWFIVFECAVVLGLWVIFSVLRYIDTGENPLLAQGGLDDLAPGMTDLRVADGDCTDRRPEVWRWLTYQFTHIGIAHVLMNVFLNIMLGIPLEGLHGSLRMFVMYNVGVIGGALCYLATDSHAIVVGCSGGCYALVGINVADLIMNWGQKKFRYPTLAFLAVLVIVEVVSYVTSLSSERTSHAAHVGGAVAGLIIGCTIGVNLKMHRYEKVITGVMVVIGLTLGVFCVTWLFIQQSGPRNVWEAAAGTPGWCWVKQIYSKAIDPLRYVCVRCGTPACVAEWSLLRNVSAVDVAVCDQQGYYYDGR